MTETVQSTAFGAINRTSSNMCGVTLMNNQNGYVVAEIMSHKDGVTVSEFPSMIRLDASNVITFDFQEITDALGPVDVLLNNAGISIPAAAFEIDDADWRSVFATNVDGLWFCSRAVARQMAERGGGSIINVGSMSATIVNRPLWQPAYLASKAAVHQLTKALAAEWAPSGIRVNAIAPGYFLTEMSPVDEPRFKEWCVDPAAMKRFGLPPELGAAAVFLAGSGSSFMTGSVVTIDGGFTVF